jgi:hypothetical protein
MRGPNYMRGLRPDPTEVNPYMHAAIRSVRNIRSVMTRLHSARAQLIESHVINRQ